MAGVFVHLGPSPVSRDWSLLSGGRIAPADDLLVPRTWDVRPGAADPGGFLLDLHGFVALLFGLSVF